MKITPGPLGKYELQKRLGEGGMAEVWQAFDSRLQRSVAIKFLHAAFQSDPTFVERFEREAQAVASLRHPNIVQIHDFEPPTTGATEIPAYMVMDYIEGPTLAGFLAKTVHMRKFLSPIELVSLFLSIGEAIDYAHRRNLLHRDIKPGNILLDQHQTGRNVMGEPILTDFGIVKILGTASGTLTSSSVGTPLYISPEQALGHSDSAASDIYSLGVILYETCTGMLPFRGNNPFAILRQHISEPPPPPESINPAISPALSIAIVRALAKDPTERFPTALDLTAAVAAALDVPLPARQRGPISSPDIRTLQNPSGNFANQATFIPPSKVENQLTAISSPKQDPQLAETVLEAPDPLDTPTMPLMFAPTEVHTGPDLLSGARRVPAPVTPFPSQEPAGFSPTRPPVSRRTRFISLAAVIIILLALLSSGLTFFLRTHATNPPSTASTGPVSDGQAFFISTGAAPGANNLGINDEFQIHLTNLPQPTPGNAYYAWLLPDANQTEAASRAVGTLTLTGNTATLPTPYVDPQHSNLVGEFSRFLVTEEPTSPAPQNPSLDKTKWRYYAEIPQTPPLQNCQGAINQLSVLCHLRHLLSGDPDLAQVHLQGGLNYWFLNNIRELQKWAQESLDHSDPAGIRHKLVNILYILDGRDCITQDTLHGAPGTDNTPDDETLPTIAAIPLLNCSLTPNVTNYLDHIHNHLGALTQSSGVLSSQVTNANEISSELNTIAAWLEEIQSTTRQLLAMKNSQLLQTAGQDKRSAIATMATNVLSGGTDANTGQPDKGVASITQQISQLATMDIFPQK